MKTFILAVTTLDGFIAYDDEHASTEWTSAEDKRYFVRTTKAAKIMLMGSTTLKTIGRVLPGRQTVVLSSRPKEDMIAAYGLEGNLDDLRVFNASPRKVLTLLEQEGHEQVAICGGTSLYTQCMQDNLVDEVQVIIEPVVFGHGKRLFSDTALSVRLQLIATEKLNEKGTMLLRYGVEKMSH